MGGQPPSAFSSFYPLSLVERDQVIPQAASLFLTGALADIQGTSKSHEIVQGYFAHMKTPTPLSSPYGSRHKPTVES